MTPTVPLVLVSDDDACGASSICRWLERRADVRTAMDLTSQAPRLAQSLQPALILLDVLQATHGVDLLRSIKQDPITAHIPVVMISAIPDSKVQNLAMDRGAAQFVLKPLFPEFPDRVRSLCAMPVGPSRFAQQKIAVIDASETVLEWVSQTLESAGYQVLSLSNPFLASSAVRRFKPDLVLMDAVMPGISIDHLLAQVTGSVNNQGSRILLCSDDEIPAVAAAAKQVGAAGCVRKTRDAATLLAQVAASVRSGSSLPV